MVKDESVDAGKIVEAIAALKDKAEEAVSDDGTKKEVNLESIVKKLTRKREKLSNPK